MSNIVIKYIAFNKITVIIGAYFLLSVILKATTDIDFCIPCLWKTIFGFHCPGCGLTTAFISLIDLDFRKAFENNWLIYIIVPIGLYYLVQDFVKHISKYNA
jgi:hypothetical protein